MTESNKEKKYIGCKTDEPLSEEGILYAKKCMFKINFSPDVIYVSPMKRAVQTADIIFPNCTKIEVDEFKETDFGDFEGKNYKELTGNMDYQNWINSDGKLPFPNGEDRFKYQKKVCSAFENILNNIDKNYNTIAIVAHGGTIKSILEQKEISHKNFFDIQVDFCSPIACELIFGTMMVYI